MSSLTFDSFFKLTHIALRLVGVNINYTNFNNLFDLFRQTWLFYFFNIWIYSDVLGECYWFIEGIQLKKSFSELTFIAPCIVISIVSTAKVACILQYRATTKNLIAELKALYPRDTEISNDDEAKKIVGTSIKFSRNVVNILFGMNIALVLVFNLSPLGMMTYIYTQTGKIQLDLPFMVKYPFNPYDIKFYHLVYLHQTWSCAAVTLNNFAGDSLYCVCCTQIHMQLNLLQLKFERLIEKGQTDEELSDRLLELVKSHQLLIRLVKMLDRIFTRSNLCNYLCGSFLICLTGFNATTNSDTTVVLSFLVFLLSSVGQVFLLCYFGDMIMRSSTELAYGVNNSKWYMASVKARKTLLFILLRSQKPCRMTAFKYVDVDLSTFTRILSTAWSYFALLKTIYKPTQTLHP